MDRDGLNGSGFVESSDEWRSLFETSNESGKLRLCQEERDRIIREQERRERDVIGDFTKRTCQSPTKQLQAKAKVLVPVVQEHEARRLTPMRETS
ncbi:hypothetical protein QZH41_002510 [Actinostola sp. cb2023]|nr:hypothetical protein QZH41_002510 [Actinostola sp. cb2023]